MDNIPKINGIRPCNNSGKCEVSTKKNHLISVFNSFEHTISDKKKRYFDKVQSLLTAWEQIVVFISEAVESPQPEFDTLFLHTLRFVLRADWPRASVATQTHLSVTLQRFAAVLTNSKNYPSILQQCRVLESVVKNPWAHPVLSKILADENVEFNDLMDYFQFENGKVIVVRLEMMLESKCEDIAVRLSKSCLSIYYNSEPLEIDMTQNELDYITDIYFCSLYKTKKKKELTDEIKTYELDEGLQLLQRYNKSGGVGGGFNGVCREARVWKYSRKVIELVANTLLANAVIHDDLVISDTILQDLISEWASVYRSNMDEVFSNVALEMIRKLVLIAGSSKCIYPFCSFLIENCGCKELYMNHVARCLIRAINQNMNEIEQYKVSCDRDKLKQTYEQLSKGFVLISELFSDYNSIYKECLLTAFSLAPSRESLQKIETFIDTVLSNSNKRNDQNCTGKEQNPTVLDDVFSPAKSDTMDKNTSVNGPIIETSCSPAESRVPTSFLPKSVPLPSIPPIGQENSDLNEILESMGVDKNDVPCFDVGITSKLNELVNNEVVKGAAPAYYAEVESLSLDESIKTDLNSILRYQRYHRLTWELEWNELKMNCEKYLELFEERGFDEVELKYLDLDYNQFKDRPINDEEYCGIEKGYEQYIVSPEESEDEQPLSRRIKISSTDSDSDGQRPKKRKKSQKRLKQKAKPEPIHDESSDFEDLLAFIEKNAVVSLEQSASSEDNTPTKVKSRKKIKRKRSDDSQLGSVKSKRKIGRPPKPKTAVLSDGNTDSQSENQPPDDLDVPATEGIPVDGFINSKSNPITVKMLREFRINVKSLNADDNIDKNINHDEENLKPEINSDDSKNNLSGSDLKQRNGVIESKHCMVATDDKPLNGLIEGKYHIPGGVLKICIPKCDNEILNGSLIRIEGKRTGKLDTDHGLHDSPQKNRERKPNDRRPKPRSSVTLQIPARHASNAGIINETEPADNCHYRYADDFTAKCEVRLPKADVNVLFSITDEKIENDINLDSIDNLFDVNAMNVNAINEAIDEYDKVEEIRKDAEEINNELDSVLLSFLNDMSSNSFGSKPTKVEPVDVKNEHTSTFNVSDVILSSESCSITSSLNALPSNPLTETTSIFTENSADMTPKIKRERKKSKILASEESLLHDKILKPPKLKKTNGRPVGRPKGSGIKKKIIELDTESKNTVELYQSSTSVSYFPDSYTSQENSKTNQFYQTTQKSSPDYSVCSQHMTEISSPLSTTSSTVNYSMSSQQTEVSSSLLSTSSTINYSSSPYQESNMLSTVPSLLSYLSTSPSMRQSDSNNTESGFNTQPNFSQPSSVQQPNFNLPPVTSIPQSYLRPSICLTDISTMKSVSSSNVIYSSAVPITTVLCSTVSSSLAITTSVPQSTTTAYSSVSNNVSDYMSTSSTITQHGSKLRAALQDEPSEKIELYSPTYTIAKTPSAKEMNLEAVQQILGVYRDTIVRFPELEHVPAPRKRTANGTVTPKRQRKCKKTAQNQELIASQPTSLAGEVSQSGCIRTTTQQALLNTLPASSVSSVSQSAQYSNCISVSSCAPRASTSSVNQSSNLYASCSISKSNNQYSAPLANNSMNHSSLQSQNQFSHTTCQPSIVHVENQYQNHVSTAKQFVVNQATNQTAQFTRIQQQQEQNSRSETRQEYSNHRENYSKSVQPHNRTVNRAHVQLQAQPYTASSLSKQKLPTYISASVSSQNFNVSAAQNTASSSSHRTNNTQLANMNGYMQSYLQNQTVCNPLSNNSNVRTSSGSQKVPYEIIDDPPKLVEVMPNLPNSMNNLISLNVEDCVTNNNDYNKIFMVVEEPTPITNESNVIGESSNRLKDDVQQTHSNQTLTVFETVEDDFKLPIVVRNSSDFIVRNETDVDGVCISIPEDSYAESFLGNFLAFIDGNTLFDQTDQSTEEQSNNSSFNNEVNMGQLFGSNTSYSGQMSTSSYRS